MGCNHQLDKDKKLSNLKKTFVQSILKEEKGMPVTLYSFPRSTNFTKKTYDGTLRFCWVGFNVYLALVDRIPRNETSYTKSKSKPCSSSKLQTLQVSPRARSESPHDGGVFVVRGRSTSSRRHHSRRTSSHSRGVSRSSRSGSPEGFLGGAKRTTIGI